MTESVLGSWLDKLVGRIQTSGPKPKMIDLDQLVALAASPAMRRKQYEISGSMEPSSIMNLDGLRQFAEAEDIDYTSVRTVLGAYAHLAAPRTYLEIGTRRGHSLCMVISCAPKPVDVYSFDLWLENYAGEANPGQQLILNELQKLNFRGKIQFFDGESKHTVPAFFRDTAHPSTIDLVFVDGDHSDEGARADILNVIDHVSVGGLLAFDDITHPAHRTLLDVWHSVLDCRTDFETRENTIHEYGWAIALRTS
jgi:predicted O-methyltransferase YrrM